MRERNPKDFKLRIQSLPSRALAYGLRERPSLVREAEKAFRTNSRRFWDFQGNSQPMDRCELRASQSLTRTRLSFENVSFGARKWGLDGGRVRPVNGGIPALKLSERVWRCLEHVDGGEEKRAGLRWSYLLNCEPFRRFQSQARHTTANRRTKGVEYSPSYRLGAERLFSMRSYG
jgi:hypothetical protein